MWTIDSKCLGLADKNLGYKVRKALVEQSAEVTLVGRLCFDLGRQRRYILNDTDTALTLIRSTDAFALLCPKAGATTHVKGKIVLTGATYWIRRHILFPSVTLSHQKLLEMGNNANYPTIKSDVKYFTISKDNQSYIEDNVFLGKLPPRVIIGLVKNLVLLENSWKIRFILVTIIFHQ